MADRSMSGAVITASLLREPPPRKHHEEQLQAMVMAYLKRALPPEALAHHSPGEGKRTRWSQAALKRSGYNAGWPDVQIIWKGMPDIFVELKTPRGSLSVAQREMHKRLQYLGCPVVVCRTPECVEESLRELGVPLRARVSA